MGVEAHVLSFIAAQPGIVAKEIMKLTYRTKGTISLSLTCDYILRLLEHCTPEEINGFFKVSHYHNDYFEEVIKEERQKYEDHKKRGLSISRQPRLSNIYVIKSFSRAYLPEQFP